MKKYRVDYLKYIILYNYLEVEILSKRNISQAYYTTEIPNIDIESLNKDSYRPYKNETVIAVKCENAKKSISNSLRIVTM